jgi:hypothetical protein
MKMKFKFIILLFFYFIISLIFYKFLKNNNIYINRNIIYDKFSSNKKFKNLKSNSIKVEERIYYNKSFGLNYLDACQIENLMKYNRKMPNYNSNILVTLILIYPKPFNLLKLELSKYINFISKEVDFNFSIGIITCNQDISHLMINNSSQLNLKYISRFTLNNIEIPNSEYFSFVTHSNNKIIDVFYTNTKYSKFSSSFLNKTHYTSIQKFRFGGYYATGTNYYAYAPSHIGLFDFFDFFLKFDHDLLRSIHKKPNLEPFPLKKMIKNNKNLIQ